MKNVPIPMANAGSAAHHRLKKAVNPVVSLACTLYVPADSAVCIAAPWPTACRNAFGAAKTANSRDEDLMTDQQTFAEDIAQHLPFLRRFVSRLTSSHELTEDIVQQTMLNALMHAGQFRQESKLRSWLAAIARNEVRQVWRSSRRTCAVPLVSEKGIAAACVSELPLDDYEVRQREIFVRGAVSRLGDTDRPVVEMCDLQLLSANEAARRLGITVLALKGRRHRARRKLRHLLRHLKRAA
jgi:RNA polymerase sigma factor (sigma-70 family)